MNKIGVFDSGIGGLSIWKELIALLPNEDTIYLADSKNAPYGQQSKEEIIDLCIKNTELLLKKNAKIIVVACNTATTNAIDYLRAKYDVPFIGIEPAIKPAALHTKTKKIGILATKGTLNSELFSKTAADHAAHIEVVEQVGEGLVPLIENGKIASEELQQLLTKYLGRLMEQDIDYLVLGCSHYPFLLPQIKKIIGNKITIIDSGEAVARQTRSVLLKKDLLAKNDNSGKHELFTNKDENIMKQFIDDVAHCTVKLLDF